jgi:large subunit ribosomal protein L25
METQTLTVERRTGKGKGAARALRRAGRIPGILYGPKRAPEMVAIDPLGLKKVLLATGAENIPFDLAIDGGEPIRVMVKELQREPLAGKPLHADFWELTKGKKIMVEVAMHVRGVAPGVDKGGVVQLVTRDLRIECLPEAIPEFIEVDVSELEVGHAIHVRDLTLPEGLRPVAEPDQTLVTCLPPTVIKEAVPEAEEAPEGGSSEEKEKEKEK